MKFDVALPGVTVPPPGPFTIAIAVTNAVTVIPTFTTAS
jgi:hypothetical protein